MRAILPGLCDDVIARAVIAWTTLFGMVSFELFGQFNNIIYQRSELFDHNMRCLARFLGLPETADVAEGR